MSKSVQSKLFPFVKLSKGSGDNHKRPTEKDWETKTYSISEAETWIRSGHGVGINVAGTNELGVIDIDESGDTADAVARYFADAGALVCITPSRGYHIFLTRKSFLHKDGKYTLKTPVGEVKVEWYRGSGARNIVLPIINTPRARLGGKVLYNEKKYVNRAVSLATMIEYLANASKFFVENVSLMDSVVTDERVLKKVFGKSVRRLERSDVLKVVKNAVEGERHNTLLRAALVYRMRGWDIEELREVGYDLFDGESSATDEVDRIIEWVNSIDVPVVESAADVAERATVDKKRFDFESIVKAVFGDDLAWCESGDDVYILTNGYAICNNTSLAAYICDRGVPMSAERAKMVIRYIKNKYDNIDVNIMKPYPVYYDGIGFVCGVNVKGKVSALLAGGGKFGLFDPRELGLYVEYDGRYRKLNMEDIENAKRLSEELLAMLGSFFVKSPHTDADVALLLASTVMSKSVVFILGESGSGKSTLSVFLQYLLNGRNANVGSNDKRDLSAAVSSNRLVGFEEVSWLPREFWNDIKVFTTLGGLTQRTLFTNKDTTFVDSECTFIFATTDISSVPGDVLRRAVQFKPSVYQRVVREDKLAQKLRKDLPRYVVGLMYLLKDYYTNETDYTIFDLLVKNDNVSYLPDWLERANKSDLAESYYYMYRRLGVSPENAKRAWQSAREGAALKGLGIWGDIIAKWEEDEEFRQRMANGAMAAHIADALEVDSKKIGNKLSSSALKIVPVLREMGFVLRVDEKKDSTYKRKKVYYLYRDEDSAA